MKEKSFKIYILRVLKNVQLRNETAPNPYIIGLRMTRTASEAIDRLLRVLTDKIVDRALTLTVGDEKKTVSEREILTALHIVFRGPSPDSDFTLDLSNFVQKTLDKYEASEKEREGHPIEKVQTRESRCGLVFSVSAAEKYVRKFGQNGFHVSALAPVALAAVLEFFTFYLLEKTANITVEQKKITLNVRHLFLATTNDSNLRFINNLGIVFLGGGVLPQNVQIKKRKRVTRSVSVSRGLGPSPAGKQPSRSLSEGGEKKAHRWRPGTKTVMQIRRLQKDGDMLMQHAPFNNLVRSLITAWKPGQESSFTRATPKTRLTADFCTTLQSFAENRLIRLMTRANRLATHAGRETVYARDVELVCEMEELPLEKYENEQNIPEASLRQLALRAGVRRFGDCSTQAYRNYLVSMLKSLLHDVVLCAQHHKIQTLNTKVLLEVLGMRAIYPSVIAHKRKVGKRSGSRSNSKEESSSGRSPSETEQESLANEGELYGPELSDVEEEQEEQEKDEDDEAGENEENSA